TFASFAPFTRTAATAIAASVSVYAAGMVWNDIADRRLEGCGLTPLNPGTKNPLPWLAEMMDIKKEQNFFEGRVTEYQKSSALHGSSDDEL
ncbi:MAG TPA: hypothetical protein PLG56_04015, partial [Lacunisphaera sp.]|nr:hypothetical protein [Lacunisphaera sp.]